MVGWSLVQADVTEVVWVTTNAMGQTEDAMVLTAILVHAMGLPCVCVINLITGVITRTTGVIPSTTDVITLTTDAITLTTGAMTGAIVQETDNITAITRLDVTILATDEATPTTNTTLTAMAMAKAMVMARAMAMAMAMAMIAMTAMVIVTPTTGRKTSWDLLMQ